MGAGEEAYNAFYRHFSVLSEADRVALVSRYPEPSGWEGFYATIAASPWS